MSALAHALCFAPQRVSLSVAIASVAPHRCRPGFSDPRDPCVAMASAGTPKAKGKVHFRQLDSAAQIAHLRNHTKNIKLAAVRRSIEKCMNQHPECLEEIKDHLEGLGYVLTGAEADHSPAPKVKTEEAESKSAASASGPRAAPDEDAVDTSRGETGGTGSGEGDSRLRSSVQDASPKKWIPHRYTRFDNSSVPFLASVLSQVEPISLSELALNPITARGNKEEKLKCLCDCLEFCTGVSRDCGTATAKATARRRTTTRSLSRTAGRRSPMISPRKSGWWTPTGL